MAPAGYCQWTPKRVRENRPTPSHPVRRGCGCAPGHRLGAGLAPLKILACAGQGLGEAGQWCQASGTTNLGPPLFLPVTLCLPASGPHDSTCSELNWPQPDAGSLLTSSSETRWGQGQSVGSEQESSSDLERRRRWVVAGARWPGSIPHHLGSVCRTVSLSGPVFSAVRWGL
jgi:hypothetical protein